MYHYSSWYKNIKFHISRIILAYTPPEFKRLFQQICEAIEEYHLPVVEFAVVVITTSSAVGWGVVTVKYNRSKILHLNQHQAPLQILHYGSNVCKLNGHKAWGSLLHYWSNDTQLRISIVGVSCKPVCFVFERARTPRHFLLGKGHPIRKL